MEPKKRRQNRTKAVLPVRVRGKDISGNIFEELAHTLDVNAGGVRLGSIRHELKTLELVTVFYRQRKMEFRVVWIKQLKGSCEYQVGLEAIGSERGAWGSAAADHKAHDIAPPATTAAQAAGTA